MVGVGEELKEGTKESIRFKHIILMSETLKHKKGEEKKSNRN